MPMLIIVDQPLTMTSLTIDALSLHLGLSASARPLRALSMLKGLQVLRHARTHAHAQMQVHGHAHGSRRLEMDPSLSSPLLDLPHSYLPHSHLPSLLLPSLLLPSLLLPPLLLPSLLPLSSPSPRRFLGAAAAARAVG